MTKNGQGQCLPYFVHQRYHNAQKFTVLENHKKSLIQHCERSEVSLHFAVKLVLPDRSILIGQKWVVDAEVQIRHFE